MTPDRIAESKALAREFMATYAATPGGRYYRVGMLLAEAAAEVERIGIEAGEALQLSADLARLYENRTASDPASRAYPIPIGTMQPPATEGP